MMRLLSCSIIVFGAACAAPKEGAEMRDSARPDSVDTPAVVRPESMPNATGDSTAPMPRARGDTSAAPMPNAKVPAPPTGRRPAPPKRVVPDPVILPRDSTRP